MRRFVIAALVALALFFAAHSGADARTRLDARVDALTSSELLTRDPAGLVDPGRQRRARAIADLRHAASTGWGLAQILAFWWLWRSGTAARLRDWLRRRTRKRTVQRAVFGAAMGALAPVAALPFALVSYRVVFNAGVTDERLPQWFGDYLMRVGLDALLGALIVAGVLALVEKVRVWYLFVAAFFYIGAIAGVALAPLLPLGTPHKTTPNPVAAVAADVARVLGVPGTPVVVLATSRHSNAMSTRAAGVGPTARVLMGDVTLVHMTPPELRVALTRAFAHVRYNDTLHQTLIAVTLFVLSAAIAVLLSDRVGFRRDDDALSRLSLVATFLGLVLIAAYPIYNAYTRNLETRADRVALETNGDRASTVRALVRYADDELLPLCDRRSIRWYFDDRPALGGRIAETSGTADPCPGGGPATTASPQPSRR
ncbi:MAG: endopeptidase [Candidatus Eremiobacteraeota bacterium]|nr:endopeptidase [Candidatus Eremiobacteraeota bacterium]MEA2718448.1 endopeptidase [Candidatus Eremiobacteraeota bacterium]